MAASPALIAYRVLFSALGCFMLATLIYTIITDGSPFRSELLTPWLTATLIDFYVNVVAIVIWVVYEESSWMSTILWIILLVCFGRNDGQWRMKCCSLLFGEWFSMCGSLRVSGCHLYFGD